MKVNFFCVFGGSGGECSCGGRCLVDGMNECMGEVGVSRRRSVSEIWRYCSTRASQMI